MDKTPNTPANAEARQVYALRMRADNDRRAMETGLHFLPSQDERNVPAY